MEVVYGCWWAHLTPRTPPHTRRDRSASHSCGSSTGGISHHCGWVGLTGSSGLGQSYLQLVTWQWETSRFTSGHNYLHNFGQLKRGYSFDV